MVKTASREGVVRTRSFTGGNDTIFEGPSGEDKRYVLRGWWRHDFRRVADEKAIGPSCEYIQTRACPIHSRIEAASSVATAVVFTTGVRPSDQL